MKADASFCYCKDVSAIKNIGSCENNSSVTIVVESQYIVVMSSPTLMESKDKPLYISIVMTSHEKHSKIDSSMARECVN